MNYNDNDNELALLIQRPEGFLPWRDNSGRVNLVQRLQPVQPLILAPTHTARYQYAVKRRTKKETKTSKNSKK